MYSAIPTAIGITTPLLAGRSDIAWEILDEAIDSNDHAAVTKSLCLLLATLIKNGAAANDLPAEVLLQNAALTWQKYIDIGDGELQRSTAEIGALATERCACTHQAIEHDRARLAWLTWEFGAQTKLACEIAECSCDRFTR